MPQTLVAVVEVVVAAAVLGLAGAAA